VAQGHERATRMAPLIDEYAHPIDEGE